MTVNTMLLGRLTQLSRVLMPLAILVAGVSVALAQTTREPVRGHIEGLPPGFIYGEEVFVTSFLQSADPVRIVARSARFGPEASVRAPQIVIVADSISGGRLDVSGLDGESPGDNGGAGGTVSITAREVAGMFVDVSGGTGADGASGADGAAGRNSRCCRPHRVALPGGRGGDGGPGGAGGDGGTIRLVGPLQGAVDDGRIGVDLAGGGGGTGGLAGTGGSGGRGCSGCRCLSGCDWNGKSGAASGPAGAKGDPGDEGVSGEIYYASFEESEITDAVTSLLRDATLGLVR